jgi:hypothetical protein
VPSEYLTQKLSSLVSSIATNKRLCGT